MGMTPRVDPVGAPTLPLLETQRLSVVYRRGTVWGRRAAPAVQALHDLDLRLAAGEILGVVGPSGSGKSTLARILALHEAPTTGRLYLQGVDPWRQSSPQRRRLRPRVQLIAQSPAAALDPLFTVAQAVEEPLRYAAPWAGQGRSAARRQRGLELLHQVDLAGTLAQRPCHALSGGQKQRLILARALAAEPRALVFDEALAAVDGPQRHRLTDLLRRIHREQRVGMVWISHDLVSVAALAQRVVVLDQGRAIEETTPKGLLEAPRHATTRAMVEAL